MVRLAPITEDNFEDCLKLEVADAQKSFVASNMLSLAQAWLYNDIARPFLIYDDDVMVGFFMGIVQPDKPYYGVWRLMVDKRFQGKGYGRAALLLAIEYLKEQGAKEIFLSYEPENTMAGGLYERVGFVLTGEADEDGEIIAKYTV